MPEKDRSSKTEPATPKRRQEARERGQVAKSVDLSAVVMLLASVLFLRFYMSFLFEGIKMGFLDIYRSFPMSFSSENLYVYTLKAVLYIIKLVGPFWLFIFVVALLTNLLQVGFIFTGYPLIPKFDRLNPVEGFKRLFSMQGFVRMLINIGKVAIAGYIIYAAIRDNTERFLLFADMPVANSMMAGGVVLYDIVLKILLALGVLALFDFAYNRWEFEKNLMMTKEEVKEEYKQLEGDPQIKARIKRVQRQLARQRMMKEVKTADVVITNPVHVAVAIRYRPGEDNAPVVIAKGMRKMAERIKELAIENLVPIVENPPLARTLYKTVDVGEQIPEKLYKAVAEILAYVFRLKGKGV